MDFESEAQISRRLFLAASSLFGLYPWQIASALNTPPPKEDGYDAWLRYASLTRDAQKSNYYSNLLVDSSDKNTETTKIIYQELTSALSKLLSLKFDKKPALENDAIVVVCGKDAKHASLVPENEFRAMGDEGYFIGQQSIKEGRVTVIAGANEFAALRGAFAFLRQLQQPDGAGGTIIEAPTCPLRIIQHWDNADSGVERGYAGKSIWKWDELPGHVDPRLTDYARLNASIGINGIVINNVNASPSVLTHESILKMAALAKVFRPYGIKIYCSINFASPCKLDNLQTADPFNEKVIEWWHKKANEIYATISDFGGFLVKANSEGVPGPQDYGRTHADGANLLAAALKPHGGIVMWRAFVYTQGNQDPDRVKRAYLEFKPLDGKFADNVLVQIKNGPLDFQPREPFHPLFGAMPNSRKIGELQITQEYTGQSTHLVYLGQMWEDFLRSDVRLTSKGRHTTVTMAIENSPAPHSGGFGGSANVGSDRNWCGHHFAQANWYAFGRMAFMPKMGAAQIAKEWIMQTWSRKPEVALKIHEIMMKSMEAYINYTMPLGLHHMVGGDHYAPLPEGEGDPRGIFHHADASGIGYDRTRTGSDAVDQYDKLIADRFNNPATCPEAYLLWFHHLPWTYKMQSGRTLWEELCFKYDSGTKTAKAMENSWSELKGEIDPQRHAEVAAKLSQQAKDAEAWSAHCLDYFSGFSKMQRVRY